MAEQRPYRSRGAALGLQRVKNFAAAVLGASFVTVNWMATQHAALLIGDSPRLGPPLFVLPWTRPIYAPWKWMVWAWHWRAIERMKPLWVLSIREVLYTDGAARAPRNCSDGCDAQGMAPDNGRPSRVGTVGDHKGRKEG
jgi:hypothetical protein